MYSIVWQYKVAPERQQKFESVYGPSGDWVRFFRQDTGYLGTILLRGTGVQGQYLTIDNWTSKETYERFRSERAREYEAIDQRCESLTETEAHIGCFETVGDMA